MIKPMPVSPSLRWPAPIGSILSLATEYFDLVIRRHDFFEPPMQSLLAFARSDPFRTRAGELTGYDIGEIGQVVWNGD